ncbi:hypothetical protein CB1_001535005 [Camelus ferus]|nr:hypothetical protein CB1_001535005 [Camelus ferus]
MKSCPGTLKRDQHQWRQKIQEGEEYSSLPLLRGQQLQSDQTACKASQYTERPAICPGRTGWHFDDLSHTGRPLLQHKANALTALPTWSPAAQDASQFHCPPGHNHRHQVPSKGQARHSMWVLAPDAEASDGAEPVAVLRCGKEEEEAVELKKMKSF